MDARAIVAESVLRAMNPRSTANAVGVRLIVEKALKGIPESDPVHIKTKNILDALKDSREINAFGASILILDELNSL